MRPLEAPAYKQLISIPAGKPKGKLREKLKVEIDKVRRLSLSEQKFEKATVCHGTEVVRYTAMVITLMLVMIDFSCK